jgi:hypothetical protein
MKAEQLDEADISPEEDDNSSTTSEGTTSSSSSAEQNSPNKENKVIENTSSEKPLNEDNPRKNLQGAESFYGTIEHVEDAILVVEACRQGHLPRVKRRLGDRDRASIRPGSVFAFTERESGIRRWTDGKIWSPSRISGEFLLYRQLEQRVAPVKRQPKALGGGEEEDDSSAGPLFKKEGLMKKTISVNIGDETFHLICYFRDVDPSNKNCLGSTAPSKSSFFAPLKDARTNKPRAVTPNQSPHHAGSPRSIPHTARTPTPIAPLQQSAATMGLASYPGYFTSTSREAQGYTIGKQPVHPSWSFPTNYEAGVQARGGADISFNPPSASHHQTSYTINAAHSSSAHPGFYGYPQSHQQPLQGEQIPPPMGYYGPPHPIYHPTAYHSGGYAVPHNQPHPYQHAYPPHGYRPMPVRTGYARYPNYPIQFSSQHHALPPLRRENIEAAGSRTRIEALVEPMPKVPRVSAPRPPKPAADDSLLLRHFADSVHERGAIPPVEHANHGPDTN